MEFGVRSIRSAGQGSGSVEVTLPAAFRGLAGLPCRLALRDGLRPEIVLQPDLAAARAAFGLLWRLLCEALALEAPADAPLAHLTLSLWPIEAGGPALAWADGLALAAPPVPGPALARSVAGLAAIAAEPLGIARGLATAFGAASGFALTGLAPRPGQEAALDLAAQILRQRDLSPGSAFRAAEDPAAPAFRAAALPALAALVDAHLDWTARPEAHAALLADWRRGVTLELGGA
jgi:hypothetical protein